MRSFFVHASLLACIDICVRTFTYQDPVCTSFSSHMCVSVSLPLFAQHHHHKKKRRRSHGAGSDDDEDDEERHRKKSKYIDSEAEESNAEESEEGGYENMSVNCAVLC